MYSVCVCVCECWRGGNYVGIWSDYAPKAAIVHFLFCCIFLHLLSFWPIFVCIFLGIFTMQHKSLLEICMIVHHSMLHYTTLLLFLVVEENCNALKQISIIEILLSEKNIFCLLKNLSFRIKSHCS